MKNAITTAVVAALSLIMAPAVAFAGPGGPVGVYIGPDIDGDGKSDKIIENLTTGFSVGSLLNGVTTPVTSGVIQGTNIAAGFKTVGFPDINGDGNSDKVIEATTGYSVAYLLDGVNAPLGAGPIAGTNVAAGFTTVGFPDLNGDGNADKVIENAAGYTVAFLLDGLNTPIGSAAIPGTNVAAGFTTVGFPDLNGDGKADKVVENASGFTVAFLMNGLTVLSSGAIPGTNVAAGYSSQGFPDINGDGKADKVVGNAAGYTVAFFMDGLTKLGAAPIAATSTGYTTVGFPDTNGDGAFDKVIQRTSDGNSVAFLFTPGTMGTLLGSGGIPGTPIAAGYALGGFPDISGDGKADKVITRASDGKVFGYLLDGVVKLDDGSLPKTNAGFAQSDWQELWNP